MLSESNKVVISTGNILNVNKKAGQKAAEELFDCLKATLSDPVIYPKTGQVYRNNDDLHAKVSEHQRDDIKIGAKIFLNNNNVEYLEKAVDNLLLTLGVKYLDNLILAYHPRAIANGDVHTNGDDMGTNGTEGKEGILTWGVGNKHALEDLKKLWNVLEEYAQQKKICQLGIADLDTDSLIDLYGNSKVKPAIAQINLSACCVVPPSLQEFCNKHDIQLLTHSDPEEIITKSTLNELDVNLFKPTWTTRYQVHIKCRGVLAAKGFVLGAEKE